MIDTIRKELAAKISIVIFASLTLWWFISPSFKPNSDARFPGDFSSIYVLMAIWGAYWGFIVSKKWGGGASIMGKAIAFLTLSMLAQSFGQITFFIYSFVLHISVPYPSLADLGYFSSIPLYSFGIYYLAMASGVKITFKLFMKKIQAIVIPIGMLFMGYYLFLQGYTFDFSQPVKVFLDLAYPLGDAIYISLAILTYLLSRGVLGGIMKSKILFILFALCAQFVTDYTFLYQSSKGIWSNGGINDFMYLTTYFLMTIALLQLKTVFEELRAK